MYDALMAETPYDSWAAYIDGLISYRYNGKAKKPLVLDLACGTGNITLRLANMGYDLIGVDASEEMLAEAGHRAFEQNADVLFLAQDMRELNLYGTVDAAISVCDGLNYILCEKELLAVFKRVRLFLNPGGVFIFDMNTEYKFKELFKDLSFEGKGAGGEAYEWENSYDPHTGINEYRLVLFSQSEDGVESEAFEELHRQRSYPLADVCNMLLEAGFVSVAMRDGYSNEPPKAESVKAVFIAEG